MADSALADDAAVVAGQAGETGLPPTEPDQRRTRDFRAAWLIGPTMAVLAIVIAYPVLRAIYLSFQSDRGLNPETGRFEEGGFAGFQHYLYWLTGDCGDGWGSCPDGNLAADFWPSVGITFFFTILIVTLTTVLGLWMATIMSRTFIGRSALRASVLIPWAIPTAVTAKLWFFIFAEKGIANRLLGTEIAWTTDPWASRFAVVVADVWKTTPFMALLILAGLQMIPKDVYEAARVDGASAWQRFTQITLPLVKPALMVAVLFRLLDLLRMYDLPAILQGTSGSTPTTTMSILVVGEINQQNYNSASALSTIVFLVIFGVAFLMVKYFGANAVASADGGRK